MARSLSVIFSGESSARDDDACVVVSAVVMVGAEAPQVIAIAERRAAVLRSGRVAPLIRPTKDFPNKEGSHSVCGKLLPNP